MAGLLYKEFIQNRRNLLLIWLSTAVISSLIFVSTPEGMEQIWSLLGMLLYVVIFALTGEMFQSSIFEPDESKKWAYFISSTPMLSKGQVLSKYYFTLLTSFAVFIWCMLCNAVTTTLHKDAADMMSLIMMLFYFQLIMRAVEMPFIVRFGSKVGNVYKGILSALVIFAVLVYLLFGDLSKFGSIESFYEWVMKVFSGEGSKGMLVFSAALPYVSLALYYLSYRISSGFYLKGAENYEK